MALENSLKKLKKEQMYLQYADLKSRSVPVNVSGNVMVLPHTENVLLGFGFALEDAENRGLTEVMLQGSMIPVTLATELLLLGKKENVLMYESLWSVYSSIDACTTEEELSLIVYEYDTETERIL